MQKNKKDLLKAITLLKQLAHPVRLSILCNLLHGGELSVTQLVEAERGGASQSHISQFLAKMRVDGLVKCRKQGQTVYYQLKSPQAHALIETLYRLYCKA